MQKSKKQKTPDSSSYLALYGSLMAPFTTQEALGLSGQLTLLGKCQLAAKLYDLGDYPGLTLSKHKSDIVHAELYSFSNQAVLTILDEFEDYQPDDDQTSLYKRILINLLEPQIEAWVYVYNQAVLESNFIPSGSWETYLAGRK
ncbi:MAG: gamma-glutamylcyclotransferase family protein [Pseudohongiellaceae bacterium]